MTDILEPNKATKRTLTALYKEIERSTQNPGIIDQIKENILNTCSTTLSVMSNMISLHVNPQNPNSTKNPKFTGVPFQVFGFDILIDQDLKAWLLEINDHPSMNSYMCKTEMGCNHKDCPISSVDEYVKK